MLVEIKDKKISTNIPLLVFLLERSNENTHPDIKKNTPLTYFTNRVLQLSCHLFLSVKSMV